MAPNKPLDQAIREEMAAAIKGMVAGDVYNYTWQSVDMLVHNTYPCVDIKFSEENSQSEMSQNFCFPSLLNVELEIVAMAPNPAMSGSRVEFESTYSKALSDILTLFGNENLCFANATNPFLYAGYERSNFDDGNQFVDFKMTVKLKTYITRQRDNPTLPIN